MATRLNWDGLARLVAKAAPYMLTVELAVKELFEVLVSVVVVVAVPVSAMTVPPAVKPLICTLITNELEAPDARVGIVKESMPVPPSTTESDRVHPDGTVVVTKTEVTGTM